jgi:RHS repeat-associated protein
MVLTFLPRCLISDIIRFEAIMRITTAISALNPTDLNTNGLFDILVATAQGVRVYIAEDHLDYVMSWLIDYNLDLHTFGARYYTADFPRFISPDPVSGKPMNPISWNRYLYCRNDPINLIDPDGKVAISLTTMGIVAGATATVMYCMAPSPMDSSKTNLQVLVDSTRDLITAVIWSSANDDIDTTVKVDKVPGQQFEEIERQQRKNRNDPERKNKIEDISKSKQNDKIELQKAAQEALKKMKNTNSTLPQPSQTATEPKEGA